MSQIDRTTIMRIRAGSVCSPDGSFSQAPSTTFADTLVTNMSMCEKCWADANIRAMNESAKCQIDHYLDLLEERRDTPCSKEEQGIGHDGHKGARPGLDNTGDTTSGTERTE